MAVFWPTSGLKGKASDSSGFSTEEILRILTWITPCYQVFRPQFRHTHTHKKNSFPQWLAHMVALIHFLCMLLCVLLCAQFYIHACSALWINDFLGQNYMTLKDPFVTALIIMSIKGSRPLKTCSAQRVQDTLKKRRLFKMSDLLRI